mmetsp:Transcript_101421/g.201482  ORF Transcript_101421/g.201482 Transcript_101421/m.201482 type:complete len:138 (+) Transcript_101421:456-869(+)
MHREHIKLGIIARATPGQASRFRPALHQREEVVGFVSRGAACGIVRTRPWARAWTRQRDVGAIAIVGAADATCLVDAIRIAGAPGPTLAVDAYLGRRRNEAGQDNQGGDGHCCCHGSCAHVRSGGSTRGCLQALGQV